jgi:hypothetical protein
MIGPTVEEIFEATLAREIEYDDLKKESAALNPRVAELEAIREVKLPEITEDIIDDFGDTSLMDLIPNPNPGEAWVVRTWSQDAVDFVALLNAGRKA